MEPNIRISSLTLRIPSALRHHIRQFYRDKLGMSHSEQGVEHYTGTLDTYTIPQEHPLLPDKPHPHDSVALRYVSCESTEQSCESTEQYVASPEDLYWKIGICLHDVNAAVDVLNNYPNLDTDSDIIKHGSQFLDIGFLTHLKDPGGFTIEFLQTTFEGNETQRKALIDSEIEGGTQHPLHTSVLSTQPFVIGQVTTRITNPDTSLHFYTQTLGMKLLSVQEVREYRFSLYFLAFTADEPPDTGCPTDEPPSTIPIYGSQLTDMPIYGSQLTSVANREWLWQRKYTVLELQWRWRYADSGERLLVSDKHTVPGLDSLQVEICNCGETVHEFVKRVESCDTFKSATNHDVSDGARELKGTVIDPDGLKIEIFITK